MKSVIVGYGNAGGIHEKLYPTGVEIVGIVDPKPEKQEAAGARGYRVFSNVDDAVHAVETDFWDICTPPETHFPITSYLLRNLKDPNILVEKPVCEFGETKTLLSMTEQHPNAKIAVNENYLSSGVVRKVAELAKEYDMHEPRIRVEFSKNRTADILKGRYLDETLGVFGYEGPHMLTCVSAVTDIKPDWLSIFVDVKPMVLPAGKLRDGKSVLPNQGHGEIRYVSQSGSRIELFTGMDGTVKFRVPELEAPEGRIVDEKTRYRVMEVSEGDVSIKARLEPTGERRNQGRVIVSSSGQKVSDITLEDNSMQKHLAAVVDYFENDGQNPSPVETAVKIVDLLKIVSVALPYARI